MVKLGLCPGEHSTEKEAWLFATLTVDVAQPTASSARQQRSHTNADCTLELWTKINLSPLKCLLAGGGGILLQQQEWKRIQWCLQKPDRDVA